MKPFSKPVTHNSDPQLEDSSDPLTDAVIILAPSKLPGVQSMTYPLLHRFMTGLNQIIGAKSRLNYHMRRVENSTLAITIPVYVYGADDRGSPEEVIKKKVDHLLTFLRNLDINTTNRTMMWLLRSLDILGAYPQLLLTTSTPNCPAFQLVNEEVILKKQKISSPRIRRVVSQYGDRITYLTDPYATDWSLFVNLTKPFDDMGMSYNALHLYEHIMTKGWEGLSGKDLAEMNGSTWPQGVCYIYSIHSSKESLEKYAEGFVKFYIASRKQGFWTTGRPAEYLKTETTRTISETRQERFLASMGRSDHKAYRYGYDQHIFEYWSNSPYELLIVSPEPVDLKLPTSKPRVVPRPPNAKFSRMPLDVLKVKKLQGLQITAATPADVKRTIIRGDKRTTGLDCMFTSTQEDLANYTSALHPLLYCNRLFTDKELDSFIRTRVVPWSGRYYANACITGHLAWLEEIPDEDDL